MKPQRLQLDFKRRASGTWRWFGWALLLAAGVGAAALAERHAQLEQGHAAAQARHDRLSQQLRARAPRVAFASPDAKTAADVRRANAIIDQLTVPWDGLFDAVEAADARGLGLLALAPTARDRTLRLAGEARTVAELLAYVESLAAQPALGQVHLLGYNTAVRDGASIVSFTMAATWKAPP